MGRFKHEAAACDPQRRVVYLTEDESDGCFYRFVPDTWGDLRTGRVQVLCAPDGQVTGPVTWRDLPDRDGFPVPTRYQVGAAQTFDGGEGCWYADDTCWFTTKGDNRVWAYDAVNQRLDLAYDDSLVPAGAAPLTGVDNITGTAGGDLYVAEDGGNMEINMITPAGVVTPFLRVARAVRVGDHRAGVLPGRQPALLLLPARHQRRPGRDRRHHVRGARPVPALTRRRQARAASRVARHRLAASVAE